MSSIEQNYQIAKEMYAEKGVNTDQVLKILKATPFRCTAGKLTI